MLPPANIPYIQFESIEQAEQFKLDHAALISQAADVALACDSVSYVETWLCQNSPSYVAGFDNNDDIVVSVPLYHIF